MGKRAASGEAKAARALKVFTDCCDYAGNPVDFAADWQDTADGLTQGFNDKFSGPLTVSRWAFAWPRNRVSLSRPEPTETYVQIFGGRAIRNV
jgi:hypothetical protein